jgi:uncharacterized membrane-anchored protein
MRKTLVVLVGIVILSAVNWSIHARERLLVDGRVVLLELAPVDPRSLMQGDYMALRFKVADDAFGRGTSDRIDGAVIVQVGDGDVGTFARFDDGTPPAASEARLRYRVRNGFPKFATNAFFFEEGHANDYAKARFGEFRLAPDGESILTGLRDEARQPLGTRSLR